MKKTLFITYFFPPEIGGIENYYFNLLKRLDTNQVVVLTGGNKEAEDFDNHQPYKIIRTDFFKGTLPPRWWKLKKEIGAIIKAEGIEQIVFGHFHPYCILGKYFNLPYFIFGHGTDILNIKNSLWQKLTFNASYKHGQKFVANSQFIASETKKLLGDDSKVVVAHPGINFDLVAQKVNIQDAKNLLNIKDDDLVMLSCGRLVKEKGYEKIIKLMPSLVEKISNLKYIIIGDGPEMKKLENLIGQLGLKDRVKLVGKITEPDKKAVYYKLAHLFVGVSQVAEGFGISYLEAMAFGLPVVASKTGGVSEVVLDNETGLLAAPKMDKDIMFMILSILTDQEKWQKFSKAGIEQAKKFDWNNQTKEVKNILQ